MSTLLSTGISVEPWQKILTLKASNGRAERAFSHEHNLSRQPVRESSPDFTEREVTPSTRASSPASDVQLLLSFLELPDDVTTGFILGSDPAKSDVNIGTLGDGVSRSHFIIKVDERGRISMRDISSRGAEVSYNGQSYNHRKLFTWMLPPGYNVSVGINERVKFSIDVPNHAGHDEQYHACLTRYRDVLRSIPPSLLSLQIESLPETPLRQRAYVLDRRRIGEGGFGEVYMVFDASTWQGYAAKRTRVQEIMNREVSTLKRLSHQNIIKYIGLYEINNNQ